MIRSDMKKLDKIWAKKVKEIGRCECCFKTDKKLEGAHIVGRAYRTTRWGVWIGDTYDLNGLCLCFKCHQSFDQHLVMEKFIREQVIGLVRFKALLETKKAIAKYQDFEEIKGWILDAKRLS